MTTRPTPIGTHATIGIVSVAAPEPVTDKEFFDRGVEAIRAAGHDVVLAEHTASKRDYVSGSAADLAADIHTMFEDSRIDAVICAGGGINANRLTAFLDFDLIAQHPKPIVGVSNPTIILNAITARTGLTTFHGPSVVWDFGGEDGIPESTGTALWGLLQCAEDDFVVPKSSTWRWLRQGQMAGRLFGGNLASIQALLGTRSEPDWEGAVLFWEDIAKPVNRLDMMLTHFRDVGVLDRISGMIVGQLVGCEPSEGVDHHAMLLDLLGGYDFPILAEVPFGHTAEKITIPIGAWVATEPGQGLTFDLKER